jgi:hypothetical protein
MRQMAFFFMIILLTGACKKVETKVPSKLTDEQLAHLMLDLQFSEASLPEFSRERQDSLKDLYFRQFSSIYKLSEEEIKEEVLNLEDDPEKLKIILERVKILADSLR